ncbi:MAG TPA: hypothetical protein VFV14_03285, partial [Myxococcaceae bacterium]|nr:hypothetical protein [Myxococcaceae bacterium]
INAPMPRSAPPELHEALREELGRQAQPVKDKAAEAFLAVVNKSRELDIFNDCYAKSLKLLRETYRPQQFPPVQEEIVDLKELRSQGIGGDIVASIQPVPVRPAKLEGQDKPKEQDKPKGIDVAKEDVDLNSAFRESPAEKASKESRKAKRKLEEPEDSQ